MPAKKSATKDEKGKEAGASPAPAASEEKKEEVAVTPAVAPADELIEKLVEFGLTAEEAQKVKDEGGLSGVDDLKLVSADDLVKWAGCKPIPARKVVEAFASAAIASAPAGSDDMSPMGSMDILPSVPEDTSFIEMLKTGGMLKVEPVDVMAAMRAGIASEIGLFSVPDKLIARMESFAEDQDEPVGENFFKLQKMITQRSYADVLSALGANGSLMSEKRKKAFMARLDEKLWGSLQSYQTLLVNWSNAASQGATNPAMTLNVLAMALMGGRGAVLPPGMMAPPDTAVLRDGAESVIDSINSVFAGVGIPVARAFAYDAIRIREVLEEPTLPAAVGSATKDQMLKTLGIEVGSDYVRLERNITRYALAIMELPKVGSGNEELYYLGALLQLGASIPWDKLPNGKEGRPGAGETFRG